MISNKINDAYVLYTLNDKNIKKTSQLTKLSNATLSKYVKIQEKLDLTLLPALDKKHNEKLSIDLALYICDTIMNPELQESLFESIMQYPNKLRKYQIQELTTCSICCDSNVNFEKLPCCNQYLCESCLTNIFTLSINDLAFHGLQCPYCKVYFHIDYIQWYFINKIQKLTWRYGLKYEKSLKYGKDSKVYLSNLYDKYTSMIVAIQKRRKLELSLTGGRFDKDKFDNNYHTLLGSTKFYGCCPGCTQNPIQEDVRHRRNERIYRNIKVKSVIKECVNDENDIAVLEPDMFLCTVCKSFQEDYNDGTFKKCPHCGIRTVKPEGCNYVRCGDHRWCFICNQRLENNHNGHNVHYYTGPGSSAYSSECRVSLNSDLPTYTIQHHCNCSACAPHGGKRLCKFIDCMNRVVHFGDEYCSQECKHNDS